EVGRDGGIVATSATSPHPQAPRRRHRVLTTGVKVERAGAQQAVLRLDGHHEVDGEGVLRLGLRLYVTAGAPGLRTLHSSAWDAHGRRRADRRGARRGEVPRREALPQRQARLGERGGGDLPEAAQGEAGRRRNPAGGVRTAGEEGGHPPPLEDWAETVSGR